MPAPINELMLRFLKTMDPDCSVPQGISILQPCQDTAILKLCEKFYLKYYADTQPRRLILGINPGRLGAGTTGIPFTDPFQLRESCGIAHALDGRSELSSTFIYEVIARLGGPQKFFKKFLISAVCPLGFVRDSKNLNYYDDIDLLNAIMPFIRKSLTWHATEVPVHTTCFCLGESANFRNLTALNNEMSLFKQIVPLPHPRWVMQYRRKEMKKYIQHYIDTLESVAG